MQPQGCRSSVAPPRALEGELQRAVGKRSRYLPSVCVICVHIRGWVGFLGRDRRCLSEEMEASLLAACCVLCPDRSQRNGRRSTERDPDIGTVTVLIQRERHGGGNQGKVAVPAGNLQKRLPGPGRGQRKPDLDEHLIWLDAGSERVEEEVGCRHQPMPPERFHQSYAIEAAEDDRELGGGIGVGDTAAYRPSISNLRVADPADRLP